MTRIIGGFAGSVSLAVPRAGTRPTSDRVREAIFSALEARDAVLGTRVLDLYAGSGALGLEAASRGARSVTLVDSGRSAAELCRRNSRAVLRAAPAGAAPTVLVVASAVQAFLERARSERADLDQPAGPDRDTDPSFDLVFADPPYELPEHDLGRGLTALAPLLGSGAIVVIERNARSPQPSLPEGLTLDRRRAYGDTVLWWTQAD